MPYEKWDDDPAVAQAEAEFRESPEGRRKDRHRISPNGADTNSASTAANEEEPAEQMPSAPAEAWPEPLGPDAYHGLTGEVVTAIEPHTESDVAAILFQFLAAVGNTLGRKAHFLVEDTKHHANLFVVLVGKTAKAARELRGGGCAGCSRARIGP